jgi:dolichol-phosphate mannosyltransferase
MNRIAIVMPTFNEGHGIEVFVKQILGEFKGLSLKIIVVDDCSTDDSGIVLSRLVEQGYIQRLFSNESNLGHGPSTIKALRLGLESEAEFVLSVDSDGQFFAKDLLRLYSKISVSDLDLIEGIRTNRDEPTYRKIVSALTRLLVFLKCFKWPGDANTPLRIYRASTLGELLTPIPKHLLIPNIFFSINARRRDLRFEEIQVDFRERFGISSIGTTWGKATKSLPNRRFVKFCFRAVRQWMII